MDTSNLNLRPLVYPGLPKDSPYLVSDTGLIISTYFHKKLILSLRFDYKGYNYSVIRIKNKRVRIPLHRAVMLSFTDNPENKPQVNHKDCVKTNNHLSNLEWATPLENTHHASRHYLMTHGVNHPRAKLKEKDVLEILALHRQGFGYKRIARLFHVGKSAIFSIIKNRSWKHVTCHVPVNIF